MSFNHSASASVDTKISIIPTFSHAFLGMLLLLGFLPLLASLIFLWFDKDTWWIPFCIFVAIFIVAVLGWLLSRKSIDMSTSSPTTISDSSGNQIITDARSLESQNAIASIGYLFQSFGERKPLPEPEGLIDEEYKTIPDSKADAILRANQINEEIRNQTQSFFDELSRNTQGVVQDRQALSNPSYQGLLDHNKPSSDS